MKAEVREIKIDRNVPIPPKRTGGGRRGIYPWEEMKVEDSFLFPKHVKKSTASALSYRAGKMAGRKYIIRVLAEGIRCWRTE